jgi:hypothetical protein
MFVFTGEGILCRSQINGGLPLGMGTGALAWRSTHCAGMDCTTKSVSFFPSLALYQMQVD